jgi:hypothetical protein
MFKNPLQVYKFIYLRDVPGACGRNVEKCDSRGFSLVGSASLSEAGGMACGVWLGFA